MQTITLEAKDFLGMSLKDKIVVVGYFNFSLIKNEDKFTLFTNSSYRTEIPYFAVIINTDVKDTTPPTLLLVSLILVATIMIGVCFYYYKKS